MTHEVVVLAHHFDMTAAETRRENARLIAEQLGGAAALARLLGMSDQQLSQTIGRNPKRNIGSALARRIESAGKKEVGWLDKPQLIAAQTGGSTINYIVTIEEAKLVSAFRETTEAGRALMRGAAEAAKSISQSAVVNDKTQ